MLCALHHSCERFVCCDLQRIDTCNLADGVLKPICGSGDIQQACGDQQASFAKGQFINQGLVLRVGKQDFGGSLFVSCQLCKLTDSEARCGDALLGGVDLYDTQLAHQGVSGGVTAGLVTTGIG